MKISGCIISLALVLMMAGVNQVNAQSGATTFGTSFSANEDWTHGAYFGSMGTFFADVDGDRRADAIVVNADTVTVRRSNGSNFGPNEDWTRGPYFGSRGTFFADVDGDGRADAIVVNNDTVVVRRAAADCFIVCWNFRFGPNEDWTNGPYFGNIGTFFADVTGDGRADAIVVNGTNITVRISSGSSFGPNVDFTVDPFIGDFTNFFFDMNADGKADAVALNMNNSNVRVRLSNGMGFDPPTTWLATGAFGFGFRSIGFGSVIKFGALAPLLLTVTNSRINVHRAVNAQGNLFPTHPDRLGGVEDWTVVPYFGSRGTFFADVTGDGQIDAIVINDDTVTVRRAVP